MPEKTKVFGRTVDEHVRSTQQLRTLAPDPSHAISVKHIDHVDALAARFIAASSLVIVATSSPDGRLDLTPRGDPAGFIHVLDPKLLALPDRPGNLRMDTFTNLFSNPEIGLIFIIPGHRDTLRVAGRAAVVRDEALSEELSVNGRPGGLTVLIEVEHVMCHCPKAFVRGGVWEKEKWPDTSNVPTLAEMMVTHGELSRTVERMQDIIDDDGKNRLY